MCKIVEDMCNEAALEAVLEKSKEIALELISRNVFQPEEIASITQLTVDEVNELISETT